MTTSPTTVPTAAIQERNRRVNRYRDLVRPIALHYRQRCGEPLDDLIQVGLLGLLRAAELYRPETTTPFEAFARPHIRGAVLHYLRDGAPAIRLPRRVDERRLQLARVRRDWLIRHQRPARDAELCGALGLDACSWSQLVAAELTLRVQSLDAPSCPGGAADLPWQPAGAESFQPAGTAAPIEVLQLLEEPLRTVVERVVLGGWSYRRTAAALKVSPMTVQRRLHKGLGRLRELLLSSGPRSRPAASAVPGC